MSFEQIVQQAVAENKANRARLGGFLSQTAKGMRKSEYAREFCTVAISLGRATGKTKFILNNARPWDIIITSIEPERRRLQQDYVQCEVLTANDFRHDPYLWRGRKPITPRTIYIDEASRLDPRALDVIYEVLAQHPDQTFVLLG